MTKRSDTKQAIIDAAFSFYETPNFTRWSLGEVAKKVGISKAAVFRHFKNKDDLVFEMRRSLFNSIGEIDLYLMNGFEVGKVLEYCVKNPQYMNYLLEEFLATPDFERDFYKAMDIDESKVWDENGHLRPERRKKYMRGVYAVASFFFFIQSRNKLANAEVFWEFMKNGASSFLKTRNVDPEISEERLSELDTLCVLDESEFAEENKFVIALSKILEKEHIGDVTIEKIANELGIAKSSLYSHFASKRDFFLDLITTEKRIFYKCLERNYAFIKKDAEFLYVQLVTTINFLIMRTSTLSLFGWLRSENKYIEEDELEEIKRIIGDENSMYSETVETFAQFVCCIAITILIKARDHKFSKTDLQEVVRMIFGYFIHGIDDIKIENGRVKF